MPIYFFSTSIDARESEALEQRIRNDIPDLQKIDSVDELRRALPANQASPGDLNYVLFPFSGTQAPIDRLIQVASRGRDLVFFIFISDDISASDYKQLVRTGNADWASTRGGQHEILDIIARQRRGGASAAKPSERQRPTFVTFVPSAGGVGNATLAIETAIQLKGQKAARAHEVCLVDLDFQNSHVCDYLDIDARLQMNEISAHPDRLDEQLFGLFVSHHSSGVDVLASPRNRNAGVEPSLAGLDALFAMISHRYDFILADLPPSWNAATQQLLRVADLAVATGLDTIPGLREVTDTIKGFRQLEHPPARIVVALNRCQIGLFGGLTNQSYAKRLLTSETVIYVRDDAATARDSINTGVSISVASPSSRIAKDVRKLAEMISELRTAGSNPAP
jgi:pilus assembly protein CpaE